MDPLPPPLTFLFLLFSGWVNRQQQAVIEYLVEENRVFRAAQGSRRVRLTDDQRRRLAVKGKVLGRRRLAAVAGIVTPDTIMRWYRRLVAQKYDGSIARRRGRPSTRSDIAALVVRMATENRAISTDILQFRARVLAVYGRGIFMGNLCAGRWFGRVLERPNCPILLAGASTTHRPAGPAVAEAVSRRWSCSGVERRACLAGRPMVNSRGWPAREVIPQVATDVLRVVSVASGSPTCLAAETQFLSKRADRARLQGASHTLACDEDAGRRCRDR